MDFRKLEKAAVWILQQAPRQAFSSVVGWGSRVQWPHPIQDTMLRTFAHVFQIDSDEAEKELPGYKNLNDFFIRRLRSGARPLAGRRIPQTQFGRSRCVYCNTAFSTTAATARPGFSRFVSRSIEARVNHGLS